MMYSFSSSVAVMRNQIARNIDVMLELNPDLCPPIKERKPERTLFLLLTPRLFKNNPSSRLYGSKFTDYKLNPSLLANDLPHRPNAQLGGRIQKTRLAYMGRL
jgi:hypothetical protein